MTTTTPIVIAFVLHGTIANSKRKMQSHVFFISRYRRYYIVLCCSTQNTSPPPSSPLQRRERSLRSCIPQPTMLQFSTASSLWLQLAGKSPRRLPQEVACFPFLCIRPHFRAFRLTAGRTAVGTAFAFHLDFIGVRIRGAVRIKELHAVVDLGSSRADFGWHFSLQIVIVQRHFVHFFHWDRTGYFTRKLIVLDLINKQFRQVGNCRTDRTSKVAVVHINEHQVLH